MKKKILSLCLVVAMVATAVVGASMAYLTDTEEAVNVMTLGNVDIIQNEQQRVEKDGEFTSDLEDFEDGKVLMPVTYPSNRTTDTVKIGDYTIELSDKEANYVDKIISVTNDGKSAAYVRTLVAVPTGGADWEPTPVSANNCWLHWNIPDGYNTYWNLNNVPVLITVDGVNYYVWEFIHIEALAPNETTYPCVRGFYMDKRVDNDDNGYFITYDDGTTKRIVANPEKLDILVLSQAIQSAGFANATTALDEGFGDVNVTNATEWFSGVAANDSYVAIPEDAVAVSNYEELVAALESGGNIKLTADIAISTAISSNVTATIYGQGHVLSRAEGYTGTMFSVGDGSTLTTYDLILDGDGATATGNLIATEGNGSIVLNEGTVLKNNNGAHAVSLATRGGGSLTLNGAQIINNSSDSGAIWGGGDIIVNEGSKINGNSSTGSAGAIRMVSDCNLTMNGGEISNNTAAGDGGAIWGYGASTYNFNGGKMSNNESAGTGGAIYTGNDSVINISGDFELCNNKAANSGAIRLTDHTSLNMTGGTISGNTQNGESNAFNTWNNSMSITGGKLSDNMSYVGGLGLTIGAADIDGVIAYDLSTNHNTAYLAADFNGFVFTVNEADEHFANFNFKPAEGYTYTEGDEAKLVCLNEGYSTYWDATTGTFRLQAND